MHFRAEWNNLVGLCDLIFTRTVEGRKILLQARLKSLAAQFDPVVNRVNKWQ